MKTSELIERLTATDNRPVRPTRSLAPLTLFALAGAAAALAVLGVWLGFQSLVAALHAPWFWMKAGYGLAIGVAGLLLLPGLARPGGRPPRIAVFIGGVAVLVMALLAAHAAITTPGPHQAALWFGDTWRMCSMRIVVLAIPTYLALALALRRLAPTRLRLSGAAAGLAAGGVAAVVYGLYCQESTAPFVAVWYSAGMAVSGLLGAVLGPRLLRW